MGHAALVGLAPPSPSSLSMLGVALSATGTLTSGLGLLFQKRAHKQREMGSKGPYYRDRAWLAAFGFFLCGQALVAMAMSLVAQTVVACLGCLTMAVAVLGAWPVLGERPTAQNFAGVFILVLACMTVVRYSPLPDLHLTMHTVFRNACQPSFIVTAAVMVVPGCSAAACLLRGARPLEECHWLSYALLAATCAWFSTILMKALSGLAFSTVYHRDDQLFKPLACLLLPPVAALMGGNVHLLNCGLRVGHSSLVLPTYEAMSLTGQVVLGSVFYQEFPTESEARFWFLMRISLVLCGIVTTATSGDWPRKDEVRPLSA